MRVFDKFAQFVLNGRLRPILAASLLLFVPIFRWASWAVVGLVTLRKGAIEGAIVFTGIGLISLTVGWLGSQQPLVLFGLSVILINGLLVWALALVLRQYASWSLVLRASFWLGVLVIASIHLIHPDIVGWWKPIVQQNLLQMSKSFPNLQLAPGMPLTPDIIATLSGQMAKLIMGVQVSLTVFVGLFSLMVARWWQASLFNPGGLRPELLMARLSIYEVAALCVVLLLLFADISAGGKAIAIDTAPLIGMLFVLAGGGLVHRALPMIMAKPWLGLLIFYGLIILLFRYMVLLLIALAVLDSCLNLNHYLAKRLTKR